MNFVKEFRDALDSLLSWVLLVLWINQHTKWRDITHFQLFLDSEDLIEKRLLNLLLLLLWSIICLGIPDCCVVNWKFSLVCDSVIPWLVRLHYLHWSILTYLSWILSTLSILSKVAKELLCSHGWFTYINLSLPVTLHTYNLHLFVNLILKIITMERVLIWASSNIKTRIMDQTIGVRP